MNSTRSVAVVFGVAVLLVLPVKGLWGEEFSLAECLVTGKGTNMDFQNRLGSYGRQDTRAWRTQECLTAQRMHQAKQEAEKRLSEKKLRRDADPGVVEPLPFAISPAPPPMIVVPPPPPPPKPVEITTKPRIRPDGGLLLLEEVREPADKRQPEISLTTGRQVRLAGHGIKALPSIEIRCGSTVQALSLSGSTEAPQQNVALYAVSPEIAKTVLTAPSCSLGVGGAVLPLPRDLMTTVWGQTGTR